MEAEHKMKVLHMNKAHWISLSMILTVACQPVPQTQVSPPSTLKAQTAQSMPIQRVKVAPEKPIDIVGQFSASPAKNGVSQLKLKVSLASSSSQFKTQAIDCSKIDKVHATIVGFGIPTDITPVGGNPISISPGSCDFTGMLTFNNVPIGHNRVLRVEGVDVDGNVVPASVVSATFDLTPTGVSNIEVSKRTSLPGELIKALSNQGTDPDGVLYASRLKIADMNVFFDTMTGVSGIFGSYSYSNIRPELVNMTQLVNDLKANGGDLSLLNPLSNTYQQTAGSLSVTVENVNAGDMLDLYLTDSLSNSQSVSTPSTPNHTITINNTEPGTWSLVVVRTPSSGPTDTLVVPNVPHSGSVTADISLAGPAPANWQVVNGPFGGIVTALMRAPSNPNRVYVALDNGGIYYSNDAGANWTHSINGLDPAYTVTSLAVHPTNPNEVYAGTDGDGVYKGDFSIATPNWSNFNAGLTFFQINDLAIDHLGAHLYAASDNGVERTGLPTDSWSNISGSPSELNGKSVSDIDYHFDGVNGYLAATAPDTLEIFEKVDPHTASTFTEISSDLSAQSYHSVKYAPSDVLYAGTRNGQVFDMDALGDVGTNPVFSSATSVNDFALAGGSLFAATKGSAVQKADPPLDDSINWSEFLSTPAINNPFVSHLSVAGATNTLMAGTQGGGVSKHNGSNGWAPINQGIRGQKITALVSAGSRQFAGTYGGGVFYSDDGLVWTALNNVFDNGKERFVRALAYDAAGNTLYMGTEGAQVHALPGATSATATTPWTSFKTNMDGPNVSSLLIDSSNNKIIAGTFTPSAPTADEGVYTSCLLGQSGCAADANWTQTQSSRNIYSLAFKPGDTNIVYGGSDANIYKSTNNGASFTALNPPISGEVVSLATPSNDPARVYAGLTGDSSPFMFSTNEGSNWNFASGGFSEVYAVQPDTSDPLLIYVGTDSGIFRTRDGGSNWTDYNAGTVTTGSYLIPALNIHTNGYLYAGTVGHSLYKTNLNP